MAILKPHRQDNRWSAQDDKRLVALYRGGHPCDWIGESMGRAADTVALRLYQLKVIDAALYIKLTKPVMPTERQNQVKVTVHYEPVQIGNSVEYDSLRQSIANWSAHSCLDSNSAANGFFNGCASARTADEVCQAVWTASVNNYQWAHWLHVWIVGSTPLNIHNLVWCAIRDYCRIVKAQVEWYAVIHTENHLHILLLSSYASWIELFFGQQEILLFEEVVNEFIGKSIQESTGAEKTPPWMWT